MIKLNVLNYKSLVRKHHIAFILKGIVPREFPRTERQGSTTFSLKKKTKQYVISQILNHPAGQNTRRWARQLAYSSPLTPCSSCSIRASNSAFWPSPPPAQTSSHSGLHSSNTSKAWPSSATPPSMPICSVSAWTG